MPDKNPDRSKAYSAATTRLRTAHRPEFDKYLGEEMAKVGLEYQPRPSEAQKARAEIERLLETFPELRHLFDGGSEPQPLVESAEPVQPGAVLRSEDAPGAEH